MNKETILRCRKCRRILIQLENLENFADQVCCKTFEQLLSIEEKNEGDLDDREDGNLLPDWIKKILDENSWIQGKLYCPFCQGKVGSFNFVSSQKCNCGRRRTPLIYLYKSRIDICKSTTNDSSTETGLQSTTTQMQRRNRCAMFKKSSLDEKWMIALDSKPSESAAISMTKGHRKSNSWHDFASMESSKRHGAEPLDLGAKQILADELDLASHVALVPIVTSAFVNRGHRKTKSWSGSIKTTISSLLGGIFSNSTSTRGGMSTVSSAANVRSMPVQRCDGSSIESNNAIEESINCGMELVVEETSLSTTATNGRTKQPRKRKHKPSKPPERQPRIVHRPRSRSASPMSIIPDYLLCSICLDIFCLPRHCIPCRHAFCEPCLKRLAHSVQVAGNRMRTTCPLCRQLIRWTEPASDWASMVSETAFAEREQRRRSEYQRQLKMHQLNLPGIYQLKIVRQIVQRLPESIARHVETLWVDYTPLVTLYSFCVSLLCILFFFTLFLPCVYLTSWMFENFPSFDDIGAGLVYREVLDFGALIISSGILALASIIVIVSIALYTLFVM